jgi:hypothetical protein
MLREPITSPHALYSSISRLGHCLINALTGQLKIRPQPHVRLSVRPRWVSGTFLDPLYEVSNKQIQSDE